MCAYTLDQVREFCKVGGLIPQTLEAQRTGLAHPERNELIEVF